MTVNLSGNLIGLSILTGSSSTMTSAVSPIAYDSKAVRMAKAQFTTAATVAPWKSGDALPVNASQVAAITALRSIIPPAITDGNGTFLPKDVQTSFTAYQALDKLRVLAETASAKTTSDAQRAQLQKTFLKGLDDLQSYLSTAPSDLVKLAYGKPASSVTSNKLVATSVYETEGKTLVKARGDAIPGLTGTEQFAITLGKPGVAAQTVTVDLSQGAQPPTLDSVAAQFNAAIAAIPNLDTNGAPQLDANGNVVPRWKSTFKVTNEGGKWGFTLSNPTGIEQVTLDQTNAKDALVVATGQTALDAPSSTQLFRFDDPAGDNTRVAMGTIQALDRQATAQNVAAGKTTTITTTTTDLDGKVKTVKTSTSNVYANTDAAAVVTDAQGNSYVVGTTKGDLGANLSDGDNNLFLTKVDGAGNVVWQRSLGATGSSTWAPMAASSSRARSPAASAAPRPTATWSSPNMPRTATRNSPPWSARRAPTSPRRWRSAPTARSMSAAASPPAMTASSRASMPAARSPSAAPSQGRAATASMRSRSTTTAMSWRSSRTTALRSSASSRVRRWPPIWAASASALPMPA